MQQKIAEKKQFQAILTNHKDNGIIKCHNKIEMKDNKRVFYCTLDKKSFVTEVTKCFLQTQKQTGIAITHILT